MIQKKFEEFKSFKKNDLIPIKQDFLSLRENWINNYSFLPTEERYNNKIYKDIIRLGNEVVPLLIEDMLSNSGLSWYEALNQITGICPIPKDNYNRKTYKTYWKKWFDETYV